jgi:hypothetical protein
MPPFHFADLALTAARRASEDPSIQARRLYDRPDALPDPVADLRDLKAWWRLGRIAEVLGSIRGDAAARALSSGTADREPEAT